MILKKDELIFELQYDKINFNIREKGLLRCRIANVLIAAEE